MVLDVLRGTAVYGTLSSGKVCEFLEVQWKKLFEKEIPKELKKEKHTGCIGGNIYVQVRIRFGIQMGTTK